MRVITLESLRSNSNVKYHHYLLSTKIHTAGGKEFIHSPSCTHLISQHLEQPGTQKVLIKWNAKRCGGYSINWWYTVPPAKSFLFLLRREQNEMRMNTMTIFFKVLLENHFSLIRQSYRISLNNVNFSLQNIAAMVLNYIM